MKFFGNPLGFKFRGFGAAFFELINSTCGIQQVLLSCIKRMAIIANFNSQFLFRGTGNKRVAAGATTLAFVKYCG